MKTACIIGAGSSGITAAKSLLEKNIDFDCYEAGSGIGGNWRYMNDNGMSSSYRSLHINTNRMVMAYADYPMPDHYPMFPHHSHILAYFENYIDHFGIRPHIQFKTKVVDIAKNLDGTFTVQTDTGKTETYQHVIVANGHHWNPRLPEPGFEGTFTGEVLHSHYYKTPDQIAGKHVLVVGIGNSAVDIACEAARQHTGKVTISTRSGAYIVPNWIWSMPFDNLANPLTAKLPLGLQRVLLKATLWLARGKQSDYGVPVPKRPPLSEHPTLSQDLLNLSGRGLIHYKPNIKRFEGKIVHFEDGTAEEFDMIVYATGYKVSFPFLKAGEFEDFQIEKSNDLQLYKRVLHPKHQNLYFLALIQPLGAIMPLAEVQGKWIAKLIKNECRLPNQQEMNNDIEREKQRVASRYKQSPRHTLQVDFHTYKESVEKEIKKMAVSG
jgi:dimethylaniline monooxygenase (N-oxide forming)